MFKASDGVSAFHLYDLQEIVASLKAGDYWAAFRKAIALVNGVVNPAAKSIKAFSYTDEEVKKAEECCDFLEEWMDANDEDPLPQLLKASAEPTAIPIIEIIGAIRLVVELIRMWRNRPKVNAEAVKPTEVKTAAKPVEVKKVEATKPTK